MQFRYKMGAWTSFFLNTTSKIHSKTYVAQQKLKHQNRMHENVVRIKKSSIFIISMKNKIYNFVRTEKLI